MAAAKKTTTIEPLDKSVIKDARIRAEAKAQELLMKELGELLKPREAEITKMVERNAELSSELTENLAEIQRLKEEIGEITGKPTEKEKASKGGKRTRRDQAALKEHAGIMVKILRSKKSEGASRNELERHAKPKLGMKLVDFIEKYGDVKVEKIGDRGINVLYKLA